MTWGALTVALGYLIALAARRGRGWSGPARWRGAAAFALLVVGWVLTAPPLPLAQKCVAYALMPVGLFALALTGAALWLLAGPRPRAAWPLIAVGLLYTLAGNRYLGELACQRLEAPFPQRELAAIEPLEAVFVMGGGVGDSPAGQPNLTSSGGRAVLAARLYLAGKAPLLVAAGGGVPGMAEGGPGGATMTRQLWRELGVPDAAIIEVPEPYNSKREIASLAELIERRGWTRVGLVSSAWHLRRCVRLAEAQGLNLTPLPADFRGIPRWHGPLSLVPTGAGMQLTHRVCWELLGAAVGR